jgi:DNA-binding NarL/FixJ family response regulator
MSEAHTPGPWRVIADHEDDRDIFAANELLATAYDMNGSSPKQTAEANARLIAAAPELLEALTKLKWTTAGVMAQMQGCQPTEMIGAIFDGRELALAKEALTQAEAAIRKAKGESSVL